MIVKFYKEQDLLQNFQAIYKILMKNIELINLLQKNLNKNKLMVKVN